MNETSTTSEMDENEVFRSLAAQVGQIDDPLELMEQSYLGLKLLLRRASDGKLFDQFSIALGEIIGDLPFEAPEAELRARTKQAASRCVEVLQRARDRRPPRTEEIVVKPAPSKTATAPSKTATTPVIEPPDLPSPPSEEKENADLEYSLPPHLAHLLKHMEYDVPEPPPPAKGFTSFDQLFAAAIDYRLDRVFVFFQRSNPKLIRVLPPPFLHAPEFAGKFKAAVRRLILPSIHNSRQSRLLSTNIDFANADVEGFWQQLNDSMRHLLMMAWNAAWNEIKLIEGRRGEDRVLQVKTETRDLRAMLQPSAPSAYDLPRIGNDEIELFKSLLDFSVDWWPKLNEVWRSCHVVYEQEKDPRVFQQQAREGALRDLILAVLEEFPEHWRDHFVLLCHRVFPRLTSRFLERFTYNIGRDEAERARRMPYLMRYLKQARECPEVSLHERQDEAAWQKQGDDLRNYLKGRAPPP